jgi:predicted RNA-binding Zn-ribbon protein involved in translation (DUF1610 family)
MRSTDFRRCRTSSLTTVLLLVAIVMALGACARLRAQGRGSQVHARPDSHRHTTDRTSFVEDNVGPPNPGWQQVRSSDTRPIRSRYKMLFSSDDAQSVTIPETRAVHTNRLSPNGFLFTVLSAASVLLLVIVWRKPQEKNVDRAMTAAMGVAHLSCSSCGRTLDLASHRLRAQMYCPRCGSTMHRSS